MKAIKFIENRDKLSNEISKYWNIISKQNVLPKMLKRTHDLKKLYTEINNLADQRALVKLKLIAINMGYKKFSDLPAELNQYDVFKHVTSYYITFLVASKSEFIMSVHRIAFFRFFNTV